MPLSVPTKSSTTTSYNVKDYGALGDGSTNDTSAITSAINAANTAGGGEVFFPGGTYITGPQTIYSKVQLRGAGIEATVLKLASGSNADLLSANTSSINLSATYGTGSTGGAYNWSIKNMTLDGNRLQQTAGPSWCLRAYGYGFSIDDVRMRYGYSGGWQSDWNGGATMAVTADQMEAQVNKLKIHDNSGPGIQFGGPHDSQMSNMEIMLNGGHGFHITPNGTGMQILNTHVWGCTQSISAVSWLVEAGGCVVGNSIAEGSDTMNVAVLANNFTWAGGHIFGPGSMTSVSNGLQIGQQSGQTPYPGMIQQSGGTTTAVQASSCTIHTNFTNCGASNGAIWFANDGGNQSIVAQVYTTSGVYTNGSPSAASNIWIAGSGLTADGTRGKGGLMQVAINANTAMKVTTTGTDVFAINSFSKRVDLPNGMIVRGYSDNYSTRTFELSNGTLTVLQSTSSVAIANNATISTGSVGVARVNPASAVTGIILGVGSLPGQTVMVVNESANTVTFAASGSNVADGSASPIPANAARKFVWDGSTSLWYRMA